jgi:hypothetical protein
MGGLCNTDGGQERALAEKAEEMRPLGKPGRRWENIIKMDIQEVGCGRGGEWTGMIKIRIWPDGGLL